MRVRHVEELASELLISQNQSWGRHRSEVEDEPVATLEDLKWADGVAFGTPTRFGNVAAQLKQFRIDCLARAREYQIFRSLAPLPTRHHRIDHPKSELQR